MKVVIWLFWLGVHNSYETDYRYVVSPFKMILELHKYITYMKHDNEMHDY